MDLDFISGLDNRSKTATLSAGYRMVSGGNQQLNPTTGTLGKSYRTLPHPQNPYIHPGRHEGSMYGGSSSQGSNEGSRPFLVSYASSNVYAEPEYHCGASNHSGDQLTGSTTVTSASATNNNATNATNGVNGNSSSSSGAPLPPIPSGFLNYSNGDALGEKDPLADKSKMELMKKYESLRDGGASEIYENNYPTYEELKPNNKKDTNSRYYYQTSQQAKLSDYPTIGLDSRSNNQNKKKSRKSRQQKRQPKSRLYQSGDSPSTSSLASASSSDEEKAVQELSAANDINEDCETSVEQPQMSQNRKQLPISTAGFKYGNTPLSNHRPSYLQSHHSESEDSESTSNSAAYNPERDFYYGSRLADNNNKAYEHLPPSGAATNQRIRRMLPQQKFGSLVRQSSGPVGSPSTFRSNGTAYQPQQYQQSPLSTRIYFNFNDGPDELAPQQSQNPYNSLRFHTSNNQMQQPNWTNTANSKFTRRASSPQGQMRTFNNRNSGNYPALSPDSATPPEYRRVFE